MRQVSTAPITGAPREEIEELDISFEDLLKEIKANMLADGIMPHNSSEVFGHHDS